MTNCWSIFRKHFVQVVYDCDKWEAEDHRLKLKEIEIPISVVQKQHLLRKLTFSLLLFSFKELQCVE